MKNKIEQILKDNNISFETFKDEDGDIILANKVYIHISDYVWITYNTDKQWVNWCPLINTKQYNQLQEITYLLSCNDIKYKIDSDLLYWPF